MALGLLVALRNNRLDEITALIDAGSGDGKIVLYSGSRPATGGSVTTEVATLTFADPPFPAASSGAMTANTIDDDADATGGTATWFRVVDSDDTFVFDGDVGDSGEDLELNSAVISAGATVSISSFVLTEGNA